jgi:large subunit ribosomal protein L10
LYVNAKAKGVNEIPTENKAKTLEETREKLRKAHSYVVMDYRGLTVSQISELRRGLRQQGAELVVLKNTLFRMAAADTDTAVDDSVLHGPTAVAFAYDDAIGAAKAVSDFAKAHPNVAIKGGGMENATLSAAQVIALAKIPPRDVLLGQMAGVLQAPMGQMAGGLNALATKMAQLLQALAEKQAAAA